MKMRKKFLAILMAAAMTLLCVACGGNNSSTDNKENDAQTSQPADTTPETPATDSSNGTTTPAAPADFDGKLQSPFIVTSCGQSPGAVMLNMVATQAGFSSTNDNSLSASTFSAGDAKTLIITTGTSGKGMGAAGTNVDDEIARCTDLIAAAREAGLTICCAHIEGMARRTDTSDQASIDAIMSLADVVLIIEESDSDGLFTNYTNEHNIPLLKVKDALDIGTVLE